MKLLHCFDTNRPFVVIIYQLGSKLINIQTKKKRNVQIVFINDNETESHYFDTDRLFVIIVY